MILWGEVMNAAGITGGLWAAYTWARNAVWTNTKVREMPAPPVDMMAHLDRMKIHQEETAQRQEIIRLLNDQVTIAAQPLAPVVVQESLKKPEWVETLEVRWVKSLGALLGQMPSADQLKRITTLMESLLELGPPVVQVVAPPAPPPDPPDLSGITGKLDQIREQQERQGRMIARVGVQIPVPPRRPRSVPDVRAFAPGTLPPIPSIPPGYVGGTIVVPAGSPQNILLLIQQQLQPNCPGTCVQFRLEADSDMYVGAASFYGGPLSADNFAYELVPGTPRIYQSAFPGSSTPIGDLQVLGSGALHVEIQL
jgi:hypothetical protein